MDPLQANDDDNLNLDKLGIHARLSRLIEKQTKRYEELISSGNHGDAQSLLQIIWQLKQLRLPGADEEIQLEHSIPPDRYGPLLEPYLKNSLNDSQLSLLFDKPAPPQTQLPTLPPSGPPIEQMTPSMPEILNTFPPGLASLAPRAASPTPPPAKSVLASLANTGLPAPPKPSTSPSVLASLANTSAPSNMVRIPSGNEIPKPSPPIDNPQSVNLLQEPLVPAESLPSPPPSIEPAPAPLTPPSSLPPIVDRNVFDEIGSGEFDIVSEKFSDDVFGEMPEEFPEEAPTTEKDSLKAVSELKTTGDKFTPVKFTPQEPFQASMQKTSNAREAYDNFEDEAGDYDNPEDNAPLRGLTTGHAPVVKKEDLEKYRNEVRQTIEWEGEEEIAPISAKSKPKTYLKEKVRIKSTKHVDEDDDDKLDALDESVDLSAKKPSNKVLMILSGVAATVVVGVITFYAYSTLSSPSFESLEKMGQQSDKSPSEMTELYEKAAKFKPNDPRGWSGLSYWQSRQGQNLLALESQAKAIRLAPKDAKQWHALALLLKTCSNYKESLRAANEAVALEPQNTQFLSLQEQVQEYNP